jgi:CheY-like chemotaxis protein
MTPRSTKLLLFLVSIFGLFMGMILAIVPGIVALSRGLQNAIVLLIFGGVIYACSIQIALIIRAQFEEKRVDEKPDAAVRVIVIDDEADILQLIRMKLSRKGFDVTTASNGDEGIEKVLRDKPDVMIVDIMMPGKDGYQVVTEVKSRLREDAPVIIMLTSKTEDADMIKGLSMGVDDYITKPFSPRELIERINVALIKGAKENK